MDYLVVEYKVFRNINMLNEDIRNGEEWSLVAISWKDVEQENDDGTVKVWHNPMMLMCRPLDLDDAHDLG